MAAHRRKGSMAFFLVTLVLALYLVNMSLNFVQIPKFISGFEKWIILIAGILLFFGGFNFLKVRRHNL